MSIDFTTSGVELWRKYVTDGVPASGLHRPELDDVQDWAGELEDQLALGFGLAVVTRSLSVPPASPTAGAIYIVGASPSGDWSTFDADDLAQWNGAAWQNRAPAIGNDVYLVDEDLRATFTADGWRTNVIPQFIDRTVYNMALHIASVARQISVNANQINGFIDGYQSSAGVDAVESSGVLRDTWRSVWTQARSNATSIYQTNFTSLSGWTVTTGAGASVTAISNGDPDPALANAAHFQTGATLATIAQIQRDVGSIPSSFGVQFQTNMVAVGTNSADFLHLLFANALGHVLELRYGVSAMQVFLNGAWQTLFNHGGTFATESWIEVIYSGSGTTYTVKLYLGTQEITSITGAFQTGGTDGVVTIYLQDGATASRQAYVYELQIGTTQLPDDAELVSIDHTAVAAPSRAHGVILVEDTSVSLDPDGNFFLDVTNDGGATWFNIPLTNFGPIQAGLIDPTKSCYALGGSVNLTGVGTTMAYRVRTSDAIFSPLLCVHIWWE